MALIRSVHALVYTGSEDGAGTDGDVYVGACGREFRLNTAGNDFERGSRYTYRFGTFPTVADPELNDPQRQLLRLEDVGRLPLYIRFAPRERSDRWKLQRAIVAFNSEETPLWDSAVNAPNGIWLGTNAGLILHLPRGPAGSLRDPGELVEVWEQLLAEKPSRESTPQADEPAEPEARLVESLDCLRRPCRDSGRRVRGGHPTGEGRRGARAAPGPARCLGAARALAERREAQRLGSDCLHHRLERTGTAQTVSVAGRADILADHSITIWSTGDWPPTARVSCGFTVPPKVSIRAPSSSSHGIRAARLQSV